MTVWSETLFGMTVFSENELGEALLELFQLTDSHG